MIWSSELCDSYHQRPHEDAYSNFNSIDRLLLGKLLLTARLLHDVFVFVVVCIYISNP